jgi:hypothetical protein
MKMVMTIQNTSKSARPWLMLVIRTFLFAGFQGLIALVLLLTGDKTPWISSAKWWMISASLGGFVVLLILIRFFKEEGLVYWDLFRIKRDTFKKDIWPLIGFLALLGPIAFIPNILFGNMIFGNLQVASDLLMRPIPFWAIVVIMIIFPAFIAISELPNYFGYVMPRLEKQTGKTWLAISLATFWLAAQHIALPLIFNGKFMLWRLLMFLPFAIMCALVLKWRPRLLPYLVIIHFLMDVSTTVTLFYI